MKRSTKLRLNTLSILSSLTMAIVLLSGCNLGSDDDGDDDTNEQQTVITTTNTNSHGTVISDNLGNVLYFFTRDIKGDSKCLGECLQNWPPITGDLLDSGSGLDPAAFSNIQRSDDGTRQTTFNGWPLYYFSGDQQPGKVTGDGINDSWYVANPSYSLMIADEQLVGADGKNYQSDYTEGEEITTFFTDINGRTIYTFANDEYNTNNYTNEDFSNNDAWPIFFIEIDALPSGMNSDDFDIIDVHGEPQLTYKGWPLYYFGQDEAPGDTKGVSVPEPGVWPIVNSTITEAPAPSS